MSCCNRHPGCQQGFSLVLVIFILVALSLLAAAMINVFSAGGESVTREVISARALLAAESGAQRKLADIFPAGAGAGLAGQCVTTNYTSAQLGGLRGCSTFLVTVECRPFAVDGVGFFNLVSTGRCGPADSPAVRVVEIQVRDIP